ncbi:MAG: c-type cytochrome [Nitrospirales bacterium]
MLTPTFALGTGQHMMHARVPADKIKDARALMSPFPQSPDREAKGKVIYEGKGTCINCHGVKGHGDGPGASNFNPPPRVFRSRGFWNHRTEGEIFGVIKHGSPGTAMIPFGGLLTDEEIWTVIQYERSFAGGHGRGGGKGSHKGMKKSDTHGGMRKHSMTEEMKPPKGGKYDECCQVFE